MIETGIITISDRATAGVYADHGGPALQEAVIGYGWHVLATAIVPDDIAAIQSAVRSFASQGCGLILTTGGTGIALRDVTPEAVRGIMRVEIPGYGEAMRMVSFPTLPNAILSRSLAAVVEQSLVVCLPGKPSGAVECLGIIAAAIPHTVKVAQHKPDNC